MNIQDNIIKQICETLKIAGDPTRLKILLTLLDDFQESGELKEKSVNEIALEVGASQSLVSHQIKVLKDGDFVKARKDSTKVFYSLKDEHVKEILSITYEHVMERL